MADLRVELEGAIATVTLDRPDALNSLTVPVKDGLIKAFGELASDANVRVIILTGAGRAFCAGQDLRERMEPEALPLADEIRIRYNPLIRAIRGAPQPVIAAVNGVAAGAGASLAFACDLRIASERASFVLAFGRVGLIPDSGATWFLPRLIGAAKAAELALTTDPLSAVDAERFGLVSRVVADDQLATDVRAMAERLAALAPRALALTKQALSENASVELDVALEREAELQGVAGATNDHAEGIAAFLEKRAAEFRGS